MRIVIDEDTGRIIEDDPRSIRPWRYEKRKERVIYDTEISDEDYISRLIRAGEKIKKEKAEVGNGDYDEGFETVLCGWLIESSLSDVDEVDYEDE